MERVLIFVVILLATVSYVFADDDDVSMTWPLWGQGGDSGETSYPYFNTGQGGGGWAGAYQGYYDYPSYSNPYYPSPMYWSSDYHYPKNSYPAYHKYPTSGDSGSKEYGVHYPDHPSYDSEESSEETFPVNGGWSGWHQLASICSMSCGGGSKVITRTRTCTNPAPSHGGLDCPGDAKVVVSVPCNAQRCPVNGGWSQWIVSVGHCTAVCGGGTQIVSRTRTCSNPAPAYNGLACVGDSISKSTLTCNTQHCPVHGGWSDWIETCDDCSVSCGGGSQLVTKTRTCTNPAPAFKGRHCFGDATTSYTQKCNMQKCSVDGGWSSWSDEIGKCSTSCGGGSQLVTRIRTCTNPAPANKGQFCFGDATTSYAQNCNLQKCPVNGGWTSWSDEIGKCSASCGVGSQLVTRTRTCTNPAPAYNGQYCSGDAKASYTKACNAHKCPVNGGWSRWVITVAQCSSTCGGGSQLVTKTRTCTNPAPANNGKKCVGNGTETYTQLCNMDACTAEGAWSAWSEVIGVCSVSCGGGVQTVTRQRQFCVSQSDSREEKCHKIDETSLTRVCSTQQCPVDGGWSSWSDSNTQCSVTCGGGSQIVTRTRTCTNPAPVYHGQSCLGQNKTITSQACNTIKCPVDGGWSSWSDSYSQCPVSCGGGSLLVTRTRTCTNPAPAYNGQKCAGSNVTVYTQECNTKTCPVNGGWSAWVETTNQCSATCNGGSQTVTKTRTCTNPAPAYNGQNCIGDSRTSYTKLCNIQHCSVDGSWTQWSISTGSCSASCGGGSRTVTKTRTCTNPAPAHGGRQCTGDATQTYNEPCNNQACPETTTKRDLGLCKDCKIVNGIGYNPHPSDCSKYIQCNPIQYGDFDMHVKDCPHGLYWDQDKLTCNYPDQVKCPYERCKTPSISSYPSSTSCRAYWKCERGVSRGKCCPQGHAYSIAGYCVRSDTCLDKCEGDAEDVCDKRELKGDKTKFQQYIPGSGWLTLKCAPGTSYNVTSCSCSVNGGVIPIPSGCKAEVYMSFSDIIADESGSGVYIQNDGVKIENGVAYFDGKSGLRIPRFSNVALGSTVYIKLRYKGEGTATRKQALITNGDCGKESSISIARSPASTYFAVISQSNQKAAVSVPSSPNDWNDVTFKLDQGILSGKVGTGVKQAAFKGQIKRGNCALQIGRGTDFANFHGYIDNMTIYLCKPTNN